MEMLEYEIEEYEQMDKEALPPQEKHEEIYSGAARELSVVFSHLTFLRGSTSEWDDDIELEELLNSFPKQAIFDLFDKTATFVQKKTAFKIIDRLIKNRRKSQSSATQTDSDQLDQIKRL